MPHLSAADWAWLAVIAGVGIGFWVPVVIASIRHVEQTWIVVLCSVVGLATGFMWFIALLAAFMLPRRVTPPPPARPGGPVPWRP